MNGSSACPLPPLRQVPNSTQRPSFPLNSYFILNDQAWQFTTLTKCVKNLLPSILSTTFHPPPPPRVIRVSMTSRLSRSRTNVILHYWLQLCLSPPNSKQQIADCFDKQPVPAFSCKVVHSLWRIDIRNQ